MRVACIEALLKREAGPAQYIARGPAANTKRCQPLRDIVEMPSPIDLMALENALCSMLNSCDAAWNCAFTEACSEASFDWAWVSASPLRFEWSRPAMSASWLLNLTSSPAFLPAASPIAWAMACIQLCALGLPPLVGLLLLPLQSCICWFTLSTSWCVSLAMRSCSVLPQPCWTAWSQFGSV